MEVTEDAVEAAVWAVVAASVDLCGGAVAVAEEHWQNFYNSLALRDLDAGRALILNRPGRINLQDAQVTRPLTEDDTWDRLAEGSLSVAEISAAAVRHLGVVRREPGSLHVFALIAELMRVSALFGLGWRCNQGQFGEHVRSNLFRPYRNTLDQVAWNSDEVVPGGETPKYWFIVGLDGEPVGAFDVDGYVHVHAGPTKELATAFPQATHAAAVAGLFGAKIHEHVLRLERSTRPGLGLAAALAAFNRKERFFLWQEATTDNVDYELPGPGLRLSDSFRARLSAITGLEVPASAWAAVDYHLSWLHAALQWQAGLAWPGQQPPHPTAAGEDGASWITGNQEDIDLIVAWTRNGEPYLVLIEAKGYSAWSTKQVSSKIPRIDAILQATLKPPTTRLVLTSPRPPQKLSTGDWPDWARPSGQVLWMSLDVPGSRLATQRVGPKGESSNAGTQWKITGPTNGA